MADESGSAFPFRMTEGTSFLDSHLGLTKREWFATNAPSVPEWFRPDYEYEPGVHMSLRWGKERRERFFAWRWYYADVMLAESSLEGLYGTHRPAPRPT